jgi:endonuclease/exonuclease/phosphatase family metal-dependent hydrolase
LIDVHASRLRLPLLAIAAILALALLLPTGAAAKSGNHRGPDGKAKVHHHRGHGHHGKAKPDLTVMTRNLYLGSSLAPALEANTPEGFVEAVARIYATVQYTNFPMRAEAIADEIEETEPDLIGLQEVTKWTTGGLNPPAGYDFLPILQSALAARGLHYEVAAVSNNANIGPAPLALAEQGCVQPGPVITCSVQLEDRDVILVNEDTPRLRWSNPRSGDYAAQQVIESPVGPLSFDRGWASINAKLKHWRFRFVNTHLETEDFPTVQEAQAAEFLAGPGKGGTIIATGDFNSASDGSTTTSYAQLTAPGKFRDAWDEDELGPGSTCCQASNTPPLAPGALNNPVSTLRTRIDLILSRGSARSSGDQAELVGDTPFQAEPPLWSSDHAGVVSVLRLGH